jgi:conjugal transfer pilus assembly protein TraA
MVKLDKTAALHYLKLSAPLLIAGAIVATSIYAPDVWAGKDGTEFDDVWKTLEGWAQGTLGKIIAVAMILVGLVMGVVRQSIMAFAIGIAGGMGLYNAPGIIESIMTATAQSLEQMPEVLPAVIPVVEKATEAVQTLGSMM